MSVEIAAMDPLGPPLCLLCGRGFMAEGYSERFAGRSAEVSPGVRVPMAGFAPVVILKGSPAGFVCPGCFGDGSEDLARSMKRGAGRLRSLARKLEGKA